MASLDTIQTAVELGWAYYVQQLEVIRAKMVAGCFTCTSSELTCLASCLIALQYDVDTETNTDLTTRTYNLLQRILSNFTGSFSPDPTVVEENTVIVVQPGNVMQTALVFPGDGVDNYTFPELIDQEILAVYRGTGTTMRATAGAPDNEHAQVDSSTGKVTVSYPFGDGESLWVEYKTTS